jgi:hypothetical protein
MPEEETITDLNDIPDFPSGATDVDFDPSLLAEGDDTSEADEDGDTDGDQDDDESTDSDNNLDLDQTVDFLGEQTSIKDLLDLAEKGKDYTQKTQELGEIRQSAKQFQDLIYALESGPEQASEILRELGDLASAHHNQPVLTSATGDFALPEGYDEDDLDPLDQHYVESHRGLKSEIAALRKELAGVKGYLAEVDPVLTEQVTARKVSVEVQKVRQMTKLDVTAEQIEEAKSTYKVSDPVAAVLLAEREGTISRKGTGTRPLPKTPKSRSQEVVDTTDPDVIFRNAQRSLRQ